MIFGIICNRSLAWLNLKIRIFLFIRFKNRGVRITCLCINFMIFRSVENHFCMNYANNAKWIFFLVSLLVNEKKTDERNIGPFEATWFHLHTFVLVCFYFFSRFTFSEALFYLTKLSLQFARTWFGSGTK